MGGLAPPIRHGRLSDLLDPGMDDLAAANGVRVAGDLPLAGLIREPVSDAQLHRRQDGTTRGVKILRFASSAAQANRLNFGDSPLAPRVQTGLHMTTRIILLLAAVLALPAGLLTASGAQAQGVSVNVNIEAPPPPMVFVTPPPLVLVPGSAVMHVPSVAFNVFVLHGRYYSFHHGAWFAAPSHRGPWMLVPMDKVPHAVRAVPVAYYKIPPGQAKKMVREDQRHEKPAGGPGHGRGPKGR